MITTSDTVMRSQGSIDKSNELHYAGLAMCEAFEKLNPKHFTVAPIMEREIKKATINKKSGDKPKLVRGRVLAIDQITSALSTLKSATPSQLRAITGFNLATISRVTGILITKRFIKRVASSNGVNRVIFKLI